MRQIFQVYIPEAHGESNPPQFACFVRHGRRFYYKLVETLQPKEGNSVQFKEVSRRVFFNKLLWASARQHEEIQLLERYETVVDIG